MEQVTGERLVTARVVSEAMGMATSQVYRLAAQAHIRSFQVGGKRGGVRFLLSEVLKDLRRPASREVIK